METLLKLPKNIENGEIMLKTNRKYYLDGSKVIYEKTEGQM